jgi:6-phosphogluconolactonase (cycloisomerase 2 family)
MSAAGQRSVWTLSVVIVVGLAFFALAEVGCGGSQNSTTVRGNSSTAQQFLYVANGNDVSSYLIHADGSLTAVSGSPFAVGGSNVAGDPNGKFLFSLGGPDPSSDAIKTDTINSDGSLTVASTLIDSTFAGGLSINPAGDTLYVGSIDAAQGNSGWKIYAIQSDGSLKFNTGIIDQIAARLSFLPDGSFAYAPYCYHLDANIEGFSTANGTLTFDRQFVQQVSSSVECPNAVAVHPSGNLLAAAWSDADNVGPADNLITAYSIDTSTHLLTAISGSPFPASGAGVDAVFDSSGKFLILAQDNGVGVYRIDQNSVTEVSGSPFASGTSFNRLVVSPSGGFVLAISTKSQQVYVFSLDSSTGTPAPAPGSPSATPSPRDLAIVQR